MNAITVDFVGSGAIDIYSRELAERPAIYPRAHNWTKIPPPGWEVTIPLDAKVSSARRLLSDADIRELDRALFASLELAYEIE